MKMLVGALIAIAVFAAVLVWQRSGSDESPTFEPMAETTKPESRDVMDARPNSPSARSAARPSPLGTPNQPSSESASQGVNAPFQVSASVHEFCERLESEACRQVEAFIDELAMEPRAGEWAADMESRIERAVDTELQGYAQIRALQCRRSRCVVEYALPGDVGGLELGGDLTFGGTLVQNAGVEVPETNATGNVVVSVLTWRCHGGPNCPEM